MSITIPTHITISTQADLPKVREIVRRSATQLGFSLVTLTKLVTATSELARNMLVHAHGGSLYLKFQDRSDKRALVLEFEDQRPGIADVELALQDNYSTGSGLGLGLGGARRLVNEFRITTHPEKGTLVRTTQWK